MALFNRSASIILNTGEQQIDIKGVRISFDCLKSTDKTKNTARIKIYNLTESTRGKFDKKDVKVTLLAGYLESGGEEILFVGDVVSSTHKRTAPDIITELELSDGYQALRDKRISESLKEGTTLQQVIDTLAKATGLPIKEIADIPEDQFSQGLSIIGPVAEAITKIAEKAGMEWSIQNDELQIIPKNEATQDTAIKISVASGLIDSPETLVKDANKLDDDDAKKLNIKTLLIPKLFPGRLIVLESLTENGQFRIDQVTHTGDTHGQAWNSTIEVREK